MIKFEFLDLKGLQTFYNNISQRYVKKVDGKDLSTNDFDNIYKEKVDNNTLDRHNHSNKSILDGILQPLIDTWNTVTNKVDKIAGMGLSTNDYTDSEKFKLRNIQDNAEVNVQNDWNETDDTLDSFIKNKPTKLSQFSNDNNFITNTVNNLQNYYTKVQSYNKTEVDTLINSIITLNILIVESLPTTNISTTTFYLILKPDVEENDIYNEYINLDGTTNGWEFIGNTAIDLSDYYKKSEINVLLNALQNDIDILEIDKHNHSNKSVLDGITQSLMDNWNNKLDKTGGTITGRLQLLQGSYITRTSVGEGNIGYIKIANFKINGKNMNQIIKFNILQRERCFSLYLLFSNVATNDPDLRIFKIASKYGLIEAYIHKSNISTWDLYILKSSAYDEIEIMNIEKGYYMNQIIINWESSFVLTLPEGAIKATKLNEEIDITGNASTATKLLNEININGVPFNGTKDIKILPNVDNTSDINKPISIATQNALNKKSSIELLIGGTDLNNIIDSGFYRLRTGHLNSPIGSADGNLLVVRGEGSDTLAQILFDYEKNNSWQRVGNPLKPNGSGKWTSWERRIKSNDLTTWETIDSSSCEIDSDIEVMELYMGYNKFLKKARIHGCLKILKEYGGGFYQIISINDQRFVEEVVSIEMPIFFKEGDSGNVYYGSGGSTITYAVNANNPIPVGKYLSFCFEYYTQN